MSTCRKSQTDTPRVLNLNFLPTDTRTVYSFLVDFCYDKFFFCIFYGIQFTWQRNVTKRIIPLVAIFDYNFIFAVNFPYFVGTVHILRKQNLPM